MHPEANKYQIRDALQKLFGVTVADIHHADAAARGYPGTDPRDHCAVEEAIVTLKEGDSIAVFEG